MTSLRHRSHPVRNLVLQGDRPPTSRPTPTGAMLAGERRILEMIATRKQLGTVLDALARWLEEHSAGGRCTIFLVDPSGTRLWRASAPSATEEYLRAVGIPDIAPVALPAGVAVFRRECVLAMDWSAEGAFAPCSAVAQRYGLAAVWASPVYDSSGEVLGAVALAYKTWGAVQARDSKLLGTSSRLAGMALERRPKNQAGALAVRAEEAGDRQRLSFLAEASTLLASPLDYHARLSRLADLAVSQVADACVLNLLAVDAIQPLLVVAHRDPATARRCRKLLRDDEGGARAGLYRAGQAFLVTNAQAWAGSAPGLLPSPVLELLGATAYLAAPIRARGRIVGWITLVTAAPGRSYDTADLRLAEDLAGRVATVVDSTGLDLAVQEAMSQRNQALVQLEAEQALLGTLFRHAPAFVAILWGPRHVIELVSQGYTHLLEQRGAMGKPVAEAFPELQSQGMVHLLDQVYGTGLPHVAHEAPVLLGRDEHGRLRQHWWNYVIQPLHKSGGLIDGVIFFAVDVTDQVTARHDIEARNAEIRRLNAQLEQRVEERTAQLQAANRELEAFSYSVSHDLRAPLRAIDGFSQMLLEDCGSQLDETGKMYVQRLRAASERMGLLMEQLLELSRLSRRRRL